MSDLDALLSDDAEEPARRSRGRLAAGTFALAVVAAAVVVVLVALLLYGLGIGGVVLWDYFFDFA